MHLVGPRLLGACICVQAGQLHLGISKGRLCSLQVCSQPDSLSLGFLNLPSQRLHLHHRSNQDFGGRLFREHQQGIKLCCTSLEAIQNQY